MSETKPIKENLSLWRFRLTHVLFPYKPNEKSINRSIVKWLCRMRICPMMFAEITEEDIRRTKELIKSGVIKVQ